MAAPALTYPLPLHPAVRPAPVRPVVPAPLDARVRDVLDRGRRTALADRIEALLDRASCPRRGASTLDPAVRSQVLAASGRLLDLVHLLRSGVPLAPRGIRLADELLDRSATLGDPRVADGALRDAAGEACRALGSVSPFCH